MECRRGLVMRILSRLSVKRVLCDKMVERSVQIFISYKRSFSLVFWEEEWLVGATLLREILDQPMPIGAKLPIFNRYSLVAPQPWHLAKKVQLKLIRTLLRIWINAVLTAAMNYGKSIT